MNFLHIASFVLILMLSSSCQNANPPSIKANEPTRLPLHLIVPDGYRGLLKIVTDEFRGKTVVVSGDRRVVEFPKQGIAYVKELLPYTEVTAAFQSGRPIPIYREPMGGIASQTIVLKELGMVLAGTQTEGPTLLFFVGSVNDAAQSGLLIREIAIGHIREHEPQWEHEVALPGMVTDVGAEWLYTFQLLPNMVGGTPMVYINKQSMKVTRVEHGQ